MVIDIMHYRRIVYTVIFGGYDKLEEIKYVSPGVKYYCVTDDINLKSNTWDLIYLNDVIDKVVKNREYKFKPFDFFSCEESIYIDGNISITGDMNFIFDTYLNNHDISVSKHPFRNCLYDEAECCISSKKANYEDVSIQMSKYLKIGFPKKYGLFENNIIIRKHTDGIKKLMNAWWNEFNLHTKRDQLSFCYILWVHTVTCNPLDVGPRYSKSYFNFHLHSREYNLPLVKKIILVANLRQKQNNIYKYINYIATRIKKILV